MLSKIKQAAVELKTLRRADVAATLGAGAFKFLLFDLIWAAATSWSGLGFVATWVNLLLFTLLFAMPYVAFRCRWAQIVAYFLLDALLVSNLMYSRTYYGMIPAESYLLVGNLSDFTASVRDSVRWLDALFPVSTAALWVFFALQRRSAATGRSARGYWLALFFTFALSCCVTTANGGFRKSHDRLFGCNYHAATVHTETVFGTLIYDIITTRQSLSPQGREEVADFIEATPELVPLDGDTRQNLVWILCESLESWVIGAELEGKQIAPYLTELSRDTTALYLPHVLSQVGDGRSIDSQLITNAGLLPLKSGAYSLATPDNEFHTLAKAMKQAHGARSYLVTVDKPNTWNQGHVAHAFGIDTLVTRKDWVVDQKIGTRNRLGDESFMRQLAAKCQRGELWPVGENAFFQVVTYSGHNPFVLPEQYDNLKLRGDYPEVFRNYVTMAHFTDRSLRAFIEYLRTRPDWANTLVVVTGDHEGLADRRAALAADPRTRGLVSRGQFVPLIILNAPRPGRIDEVVGQIDAYPSLLQMLGLTGYGWHGVGRSFLTARPGFAVDNRGAAVGDTAGRPLEVRRAVRARDVSDKILRYDLLR